MKEDVTRNLDDNIAYNPYILYGKVVATGSSVAVPQQPAGHGWRGEVLLRQVAAVSGEGAAPAGGVRI